ncbi:hypothetical protein BMS3Bbin04_01531 [bacterium BMS3Bbin04]|nr:hypothetical protein BMS3Bbin04_01531 [bacterium BMS3Bbin04]
MKNLIVCCDGTWNTPGMVRDGVCAPTNVTKFYQALEKNDEQIAEYFPGVGTEGGFIEKKLGGMIGKGLEDYIKQAYEWLGLNYEDGDKIFLIGFSRGAFTARSLAGMISTAGLLDLSHLKASKHQYLRSERVDEAYADGYKDNGCSYQNTDWARNYNFLIPKKTPKAIHFVGVWDTVGALGIPDDLGLLNMLDDDDKWGFHDTNLGAGITNARHAVAIDEMRASFTATLWTDVDSDSRVKQVWFPGGHSDIGGGNAQSGLANAALKWMVDEAGKFGLTFQDHLVNSHKPDAADAMHHEVHGIWDKLRTRPRNIPEPIVREQATVFHNSVFQRQSTSESTSDPYRPTHLIKIDEQTPWVHVYAETKWNNTGIYLEKGTYEFEAKGRWQDQDRECDPDGPIRKKFSAGYLIANTIGRLENGYKRISGQDQTNFLFSKRFEDAKFFCLIGAIANDGRKSVFENGKIKGRNPGNDGSPYPHEQFKIGSAATYVVERPGYLYCYANDVLQKYGNNNGHVKMRVKRIG